MYFHTFLIDNGFGSRQRLLSNSIGFRAALERPFGNLTHAKIPPASALCNDSYITYYSFSSVLAFHYFNTSNQICQSLR